VRQLEGVLISIGQKHPFEAGEIFNHIALVRLDFFPLKSFLYFFLIPWCFFGARAELFALSTCSHKRCSCVRSLKSAMCATIPRSLGLNDLAKLQNDNIFVVFVLLLLLTSLWQLPVAPIVLLGSSCCAPDPNRSRTHCQTSCAKLRDTNGMLRDFAC
jgi:hypothetical protein